MPERSVGSANYRYLFNGMEVDNEVSGNENSYTTEFRQYDPRLGRWKSLDPLMYQFPWMSPYVAFDNNPIYYTDPLGLASEGGPEKDGTEIGEIGTGDDGNDYIWADNGDGKGSFWAKIQNIEEVSVSAGNDNQIPASKDINNLDYVDKYIFNQGINSFGPKKPTFNGREAQWERDFEIYCYKQSVISWEKRTLDSKWLAVRQKLILNGVRKVATEAMEPVAELYKIQTVLGGSGMATLARSSVSTIASREFKIINPNAPATNIIRKTTIGADDVLINSGHAFNKAHRTGSFNNTNLSLNVVENAIVNDLKAFIDAGNVVAPVGNNMTKRNILVNGVRVNYSVGRSNGVYRVTTYTPY